MARGYTRIDAAAWAGELPQLDELLADATQRGFEAGYCELPREALASFEDEWGTQLGELLCSAYNDAWQLGSDAGLAEDLKKLDGGDV